MAEEWQVDAIRDELKRADDIGETRSEAQLRELIGIGQHDLSAAIEELRSNGVITNTAPGEWGIREGRAPAAAPASDDEDAAPRGVPVAELKTGGGDANAAGRQAAAYATVTGSPRVVMPRSMVDAMDAAVLGGILKAGIESAEGDSFVFEVAL